MQLKVITNKCSYISTFLLGKMPLQLFVPCTNVVSVKEPSEQSESTGTSGGWLLSKRYVLSSATEMIRVLYSLKLKGRQCMYVCLSAGVCVCYFSNKG